jgi:CheY-like chemotaxis protein
MRDGVVIAAALLQRENPLDDIGTTAGLRKLSDRLGGRAVMAVLARRDPEGQTIGEYLGGVSGQTHVMPGVWAAAPQYAAVTLLTGRARVQETILADRPHVVQTVPIPGEWLGGRSPGSGSGPLIGYLVIAWPQPARSLQHALGLERRGTPNNTFSILLSPGFDADRLRATLHIMFGYTLEVRRARTLGSALDCVIERQPELIFLDDYLKPSDNATHTIPFLRRCGYTGPIIVVSGQVDRLRRAMLVKAGAVDVIHKDDLDSVRIAEALARAGETPQP